MIKELKIASTVVWIILTAIYATHFWILQSKIGLEGTLQNMKDESSRLTLENNILENEIAKQSSLRVLEQKASNLGFSETKKVEWIK